MPELRIKSSSGEDQAITTGEALNELLDRLDFEARAAGRPRDVQMTANDGTLAIVLGHERSVLNHIPADGNPPYMTSLGEDHSDRPFTFYVDGDHHSEAPWRNTVPIDAARAAAEAFLEEGGLDDRLWWEEV